MPYVDKTLTCRDCGRTFTWTAGEQEFYAGKGFNAPTRCPDDRAKRKAEQSGKAYSVQRTAAPTTIVCQNCGDSMELPFTPTEANLLCSTCFMLQAAGDKKGFKARAKRETSE